MNPDDFQDLAFKVIFGEADSDEANFLQQECSADPKRAAQVNEWRRDFNEARTALPALRSLAKAAGERDFAPEKLEEWVSQLEIATVVSRTEQSWWRQRASWIGVAAAASLVVLFLLPKTTEPTVTTGVGSLSYDSRSGSHLPTSNVGRPATELPALSAAKMQSLLDQLSPADREKMDVLSAEHAWARFSIVKGTATPASTSSRERAAHEALESRSIRNYIDSQFDDTLRLEALRALCFEASESVRLLLERAVDERQPTGSRFAVVVGCFDFARSAGAAVGPELAELLKNPTDALSANDRLREKYALVSYPVTGERSVVLRLGGGSDAWIKSKTILPSDPAVALYHPDDLHVLTGTLTEKFEANGSLRYELSLRLIRPRSDRQRLVSVVRTYFYHPTRLWLTEGQNRQLKHNTAP